MRGQSPPKLLDIGRRADERQRDEVRSELGGHREISLVLIGDRRQLGPGVSDVDSLARRKLTRPTRPSDDLTGADRVDHQARNAVTDHDLRTLGNEPRKVREVHTHASVTGRLEAVKTTFSPGRSILVSVSADSRSFGPCRSNSSPTDRPARLAAARTSAARRRSSSAVPCEQFSRAQSIPAAIRASTTRPDRWPAQVSQRSSCAC